jgi:hypothetical protein
VDSDLQKLLDQIQLVAGEIICLKLGNLIPICFGTPRKIVEEKIPDADFRSLGKEEDVGFGDTDDPLDEQEQYVSVGVTRAEVEAQRRAKDPNYVEPDRTSSSHIDFGLILPKFTNLKVLTLVYEMAETGLDWEARFFKFTDEDCLNLAVGKHNIYVDGSWMIHGAQLLFLNYEETNQKRFPFTSSLGIITFH